MYLMVLLGIWMSILVGVLIGWSWKPKWAFSGNDKDKLGCPVPKDFDFSQPSSLPRSPLKGFSSVPCLKCFESLVSQGCEACCMGKGIEKTTSVSPPATEFDEGSRYLVFVRKYFCYHACYHAITIVCYLFLNFDRFYRLKNGYLYHTIIIWVSLVVITFTVGVFDVL